jgi:hypothetical protein
MLFLYEQYLSLSTIVFMICTDQRKTVGIKRIPPVFFIPNRNTSFIVTTLLGEYSCKDFFRGSNEGCTTTVVICL